MEGRMKPEHNPSLALDQVVEQTQHELSKDYSLTTLCNEVLPRPVVAVTHRLFISNEPEIKLLSSVLISLI